MSLRCTALLSASVAPLEFQRRYRSNGVACESSTKKTSLTVEDIRTGSKAQQWVELHADKSKSVLVNTDSLEWVSTGASGVHRKLIERLGGEVARATSIVSFEPNKTFPAHTHGGGEEFLVLEGAWNDEWAVQPKYTYVRNYIGSRHSPSIGAAGCTILVKLRQMSHEHREADHTQWDVSPDSPTWVKGVSDHRWTMTVYNSPFETVHFERWMPGTTAIVEVPTGGEEVFVIEGDFSDELGDHKTWSWARNAKAGEKRSRVAGPKGCFLYIKSRHLQSPEVGVGE